MYMFVLCGDDHYLYSAACKATLYHFNARAMYVHAYLQAYRIYRHSTVPVEAIAHNMYVRLLTDVSYTDKK